MTKVLVGFMTSIKDGGINKYLMNMIDLMKDEEVSFDVLTSNEENFASIRDFCNNYGGNAFLIPRVIHPTKQEKAVSDIIKNNNYDICYFNISEAFNYIAAKAASKCGVKKIYIHSHSSGNDTANPMKRKMLESAHFSSKKKIEQYGTDFFSCSDLAGKWMYSEKILSSEKYHIIYNAVDYDKFKYNVEIREEYRTKLGIKDKFVVGHVSNYVYQKNIPYLIEIIKELSNISDDTILLSVGEGPEWEGAKEEVIKLGIKDRVMFLGVRQDVPAIMQAMDCFVLPSRFEGLPIVGVEAQLSGLKCLFSDTITKEVRLCEETEFLSITDPAKLWADKISSLSKVRLDTSKLENGKFDIKSQKEMFKKMFAQI